MFIIKMVPRDQDLLFFFNITFNIVGGIEGNLNTIGTATLNSLGLKEKAGLMPRGEK